MASKRITAAELLARLASDPVFTAAERARDEKRAARAAESSRAEAPIVAAIRATGTDITSIGQLWKLPGGYAGLVPLLIEHARDESYPRDVREAIIRAIGVRAALPYWDQLVDFFVDNSLNLAPEDRHWTAFALADAADERKIDDLIGLIKDTRFGADRLPFITALHASKNPKAKMTLMQLRDDATIGRELKRQRRIARLEKP